MDVFHRLVFIFTVALFDNMITSDHPVQLDQVHKVNHEVPKEETHSCFSQPCMGSTSDDMDISTIISVALVSVLVLTGLGCLLLEACLGKGRSKSNHRRAWSRSTPTKAIRRSTVNFDIDDILDNDLYSFEKDDNSVLEGPEFSMIKSYNVEPVAACSPYHLAWTTPSGRKMSETIKEIEPCAFTVVNEFVDQSSKPECDQSISSSTPYRTPLNRYAHPTPMEQLALIRPGLCYPAMRTFTAGPIKPSITPKKLFLVKRRQSLQTTVQRHLGIQRCVSRSDDTQGNSLLWDSYIFRCSEESLAWDDYMSDKMSISKIDENCNDPTCASREDGVHA